MDLDDKMEALRAEMQERGELLLDLAAGTMSLWQDAVERGCGQWFGLAWSMLGATGALAGNSERAPERIADLQRELVDAGERASGEWLNLQKDVADLWGDVGSKLSAMSVGGFDALTTSAALMLPSTDPVEPPPRTRRAPRRTAGAQAAIRAGGARRTLNA